VADALDDSTATDRAAVAHEVTRAALMGARGNSGVILSQIVRGAAEVLGESDDVPRAVRSASDAAYRAVRNPVEGTMLTAVRELAEEAERHRGAPPAELLPALVRRGDDCVARTKGMLDVLREAGVVDAGAAGLVEIVRGIAAAVCGEALPGPPARDQDVGIEAIHRDRSRFRYCTVFVVEGEGLDTDEIEAELAPLGDSLLVVGDPTAIKVHVHTDEPGAALSVGVARGTIGGVEIANMHEQTAQREERLLEAVPDRPPAATDVVAVVAGAGNRRLFESLGARVVDGGRTMNPATAEILAAIDAAGAAGVLVLPNNANVVLAAEQAVAHAARPARVLPTVSLQAGLAALVAFDPEAPLDANLDAMQEAVAAVATGAVTVASRDVELDGVAVRSGAWLGLAEGRPVAGGDSFDEVATAVVERLLAHPREVLTLLTGEDGPELDALLERVAGAHPGLELEVHEGGQPHYPLLVSAE
ncbi:MAG TPA: DAK2 domain-containing protein, partial [Gaiellaceae bacterium]|nr:DAK2 domain-containing protein [Gaiellaceae bacterium]